MEKQIWESLWNLIMYKHSLLNLSPLQGIPFCSLLFYQYGLFTLFLHFSCNYLYNASLYELNVLQK